MFGFFSELVPRNPLMRCNGCILLWNSIRTPVSDAGSATVLYEFDSPPQRCANCWEVAAREQGNSSVIDRELRRKFDSMRNLHLLSCCGMFFAAMLIGPATPQKPAIAGESATDSSGVQLRWKFVDGQQLSVVMVQEMKQEVEVAGQEMITKMLNKTWTLWRPESTQADGSTTIASVISRVKLEVDSPGIDNLVIDTDLAAADGGQAAALDAIIRPMVGVKITNRMSPRGEVTDVKIPEDIAAALQGAGGVLSAEQISEMMQKVSPVFPAQGLQEGDSWAGTSAIETPVGKINVKSKYTYEGQVEVESRPLHSIKVEIMMDIEGAARINFGDQDSTGIMLFDNVHGRLVRSDVDQNFSLEVEVAPGQTLKQRVSQKMSNVVEEAKN